jgi:hypothetical protein
MVRGAEAVGALIGPPGSSRRTAASLPESSLSAARKGDWRAADALMNRIYRKPQAALVEHVSPNPAVEVIRSLPLEEKLELLHSLRSGEQVALAVVESVPSTG